MAKGICDLCKQETNDIFKIAPNALITPGYVLRVRIRVTCVCKELKHFCPTCNARLVEDITGMFYE